ncbi:MAG: 4Fe-4S binding protein [Methanomassiliicoccales archaeon]|nr:4Fe-4S binding protein [Methanomassiliicoccales archaeon]
MSAKLKQQLRRKCASLDIPMMGVAPVERWEKPPFEPWVPEAFWPRSIFPEARSVVVIGLPITLPILETSPSIFYHELYKNVNSLLDQYTYRLALYLSEKGFPSLYIPRDGYGHISLLKDRPLAFFSHRHAAYLAGLGSFGVSNMILTRKYGPRVRFGALFTSAKLPGDPLLDEQLCIRCMRCVKICPVGALERKDYPEGLADKRACTERNEILSERFVSPCGFCIKVCPVGEDRKEFSRADASIYEAGKAPEQLDKAWKHVRAYGSR